MVSRSLLHKLLNLTVIVLLLGMITMTANADGSSPRSFGRPLPDQGDDGDLPGPSIPNTTGRDFSSLPTLRKSADAQTNPLMGSAASANSVVAVSVQLAKPSLAQTGKTLSGAQRLAYAAEVSAYQDRMAADLEASGAKIIYRFRTLSSGFIVEMPVKAADQVLAIPGVERISRIHNYQKDLSETVPFIGGDAMKRMGYDGSGVTVAVLDSGIDFTHKAFGGPGTEAAWKAAYWGSASACINGLGRLDGCANNVSPEIDANFGPASQIKGGYDWVGPVWPYGNLAPDANPIANRQDTDAGDDGTHGSHVADIIAGQEFFDGSAWVGAGMAPGADLYAFTVCSQVDTACSGVAMLQGLDSAADLDDNPFTYDPADVVNMSIGSDYGQPEDDATFFVNELVTYGSIVSISAGNSANKPFVVGSPSTASGAISVAQTNVPSAVQIGLTINTTPDGTPAYKPTYQAWSAPLATAITGDVVYDITDTDTGTNLGCSDADGASPWASATLFTNKVLLVDRGTCAVSLKASNGFAAGARMVLVAMVNGDDPAGFSYGGGTVTGPVFSISLADGDLIKDNLPEPIGTGEGITVTANPADLKSLANFIAGTSSRGPRNHDNKIKPDLGAPGASVSAVAGSGNQAEAFGGTSGAAPMVAGAAALLKEVYGDSLTPQQYKALLMNSANNQIYDITPSNLDGELLPITRIGAGQVDLETAMNTRLIAWDVTESDPLSWTGSLSFMYQPVSETASFTRTLRILNQYYNTRTVYLQPAFRYNNDWNRGVGIETSEPWVTIGPGETADVDVTVTLEPAELRAWFDNDYWWFDIDRGYFGGDGHALTAFEMDGYVNIATCTGDPSWPTSSCVSDISVPWHVLPKPVGDTTVEGGFTDKTLTFTNASSAVENNVDLFGLIDQSPNDYLSVIGDCGSLGLPEGCNVALPDIKEVGVRALAGSGTVDFGVSLWNEPFYAGSYPVEVDVYIDTDRDGDTDYVAYNYDTGGSGAVWVYSYALDDSSPVNYLDSTFDSNNYILPVPLAAIGLKTGDSFDFRVYAYDSYFTGWWTDCALYNWDTDECGIASYTVGAPVFVADAWTTTVPAANTQEVSYTLNSYAVSSEIGLLAMYREAAPGAETYSIRLARYNHFIPMVIHPE